MNPQCDPDAVFDLADGALDGPARAQVEVHLLQCQSCQVLRAQLEHLEDLAGGLLRPEAEEVLPQAPPRIWRRLEAGRRRASGSGGTRPRVWPKPMLLAAGLALAVVASYPLLAPAPGPPSGQDPAGELRGQDPRGAAVHETLRGSGSSRAARAAKKLASPDVDVRVAAAETLSLLGAEAREAVPELVQALGDPEAVVRAAAAAALGRIGVREPALPALEKLQADPDEAVRKAAAEALERLRAAASGAGG